MKIYFIQLQKNQIVNFIKFAKLYSICIYLTWKEETFLDELYFVTCTNEGDAKISAEEKERLINENYGKQIKKTETV